jgi:uncharacterized protein YbjT (DUF2867 family)
MSVPPPAPVLVAGATGALGRHVVTRLLEAGQPVRALVRDPARLGALAERVELHVGDALSDARLAEAMRGARAVFSSLGASVQPSLGAGRRSYAQVDVPANLRLVEAARAAGVPRFVYVSLVLTPRAGATAYVRAHERVVEALRGSGLDWCALRPTGFHSVFASMLDLAARGRVPVFGRGEALSNPIADIDLAALAAEQLLSDGAIAVRELPLGGPEIISRRRIAELACEAVGQGRPMTLPPLLGRVMATLVRPISPRMSDLLRFALAIGDEDAIAPCVGTTTLADSFAAVLAVRRGARTLPARAA